MDFFESEGKTVEEALQKICIERNWKEEDTEYEIIDQKKKLFGVFGKENVQIKAWRKKEEHKQPKEFIIELFQAANFDCEAEYLENNEDKNEINIIGNDVKIIIGKNGEVLDALQYLINKMANRGTDKTKIVLDADGYRQRKEKNLRRIAIKTAEKVKETKKSSFLSPMNAQDRRIVHMTLKEDKEVYTKSFGNGSLKKVLINVKGGGRSNSRQRRKE